MRSGGCRNCRRMKKRMREMGGRVRREMSLDGGSEGVSWGGAGSAVGEGLTGRGGENVGWLGEGEGRERELNKKSRTSGGGARPDGTARSSRYAPNPRSGSSGKSRKTSCGDGGRQDRGRYRGQG